MTFRTPYAIATLILFVVEVLIALYLHDNFVRPYVGDSIVVVLMYVFFRAITPMQVVPAVVLCLAIAVAVEFGQLYHLVDRLGLGGNALARVVIGTGFEVKDLFAYAAGGLFVLIVEAARKQKFI